MWGQNKRMVLENSQISINGDCSNKAVVYALFLSHTCVAYTLIACLFANIGKRYLKRIFFLTFSYWLVNRTEMDNWFFIFQLLRLLIGGGVGLGGVGVKIDKRRRKWKRWLRGGESKGLIWKYFTQQVFLIDLGQGIQ